MDALLSNFQSVYAARQTEYRKNLQQKPEGLAYEVMRLLGREHRAIVVYPEAVHWEPQQRPHHWLREMAKRGYLCFFCDPTEGEEGLREAEPNLFVVRGQGKLLHAMRSQTVIVLCTWMMQMAWADLLPHKIIWYDLVDSLEFFSLYDEAMLDKHRQVMAAAEVVTYSALQLKKYIGDRPDAHYLPNAAFPEDFAFAPGGMPTDLWPIAMSGAPIIGYFGALEEWFDAEMIRQVARRRPEWQFVFIGRNRLPPDRLAERNIHFLGLKDYKRLKEYGAFFHVGIIPFIVNEMTNGVSPVKFFEFAALGLPVVTTPIAEMLPYRSDWVRIASDAEQFESAIAQCLLPEIANLAKREGRLFASRQTWSERFEQVQRQFDSNPKVWKAFANDRPAGKVAVMAATFLDFDGESFYSGGAERYLLDLSRLCRRMGLECVIYQYGNYAWRRRLQDVDVVSLSRGGQHARIFNVPTVSLFSRLFAEQTDERAALTVYSAYFNAWPHGSRCPSIGIVHGVCWDDPNARFADGQTFWERNRRFIEGARLCGQLVSVDTNSANWFQTIDYESSRNIQVIPNYVEEEEFFPRADYLQTGERIVILYPRRLYRPRGLYMVLDVIERILERYPHVDFHFVGKGEAADTERVDEISRRWGNRVRRYSLPMKEMSQAYETADITLIPTLYSEGTSLSCLEAMACGNAVIATRIGGLSDLVIDDYNGRLIEPNSEALYEAIQDLLERPDKLMAMKRQAVEVAKVFSKRRWERKWAGVIESAVRVLPEKKPMEGKGRLLEVYLADTVSLGAKFGATISGFLERGDLVYLRIKDYPLPMSRAHSFGRLQWMDWRELPLAEPDLILTDRASSDKTPRPADAIWSEEGEWEWISSSRPSSTGPDRH